MEIMRRNFYGNWTFYYFVSLTVLIEDLLKELEPAFSHYPSRKNEENLPMGNLSQRLTCGMRRKNIRKMKLKKKMRSNVICLKNDCFGLL